VLTCRIYPNGEFSVWDQRKTVAVEPPPDEPDAMGLSLLANSHRIALGLAEPPPARAQRGSRGITRLGARTVRNAAFLLEQKYGCDRLSFLTCTLPPVAESDEYNAGRCWAEICRQFFQSLGRLLTSAGLPASFVSCTEIQPKRFAERGGLPLHLHVVFPGRLPYKKWAISTQQIDALWSRAVIGRCPEFAEAPFRSACNIQRVKKSAESYLGKYMSKGASFVGAVLNQDAGLAEFMPRTWWNCSLNLRRAIGRRVSGGNATARVLVADISGGDTRVSYSRVIKIELGDGAIFDAAIVGRLSSEGRLFYERRSRFNPLL